ncbi:hypothetical protein LINPERPRIM_LOCUS37822 [Linum perenne]
MKRSKPNYVAPGLLNKYSKKPMSFKSFSSRSNLTKRQELLFKDSLTQVNEEPSRTPPATTDNVDIEPHVPPMSEQNRHDEIMEEINAEIIEEIDPEFNVQALEDIDLAINDDSQNEQNLNENENAKKNGRGKNKCVALSKLNVGEKLAIQFRNGRAVGPNAKVFSRSLGIIVRSPRVVPVKLMRWSELSDVDIDFLWAVAQEHFQHSDMAAQKDSVLRHARILWNKSRSFLYRYFVAKCNTTREAIKNIPPMMDKEDWKWLVEKVFLSDKFQKKSQIGKTIRKNKKLKHYNGSRPVGEKIHNHIEQYGEEPSYHTILEYAYKKGETVQDAYAAEKIELAKKTKEEAPDSTIYDIAKKCFGKQLKHGTVIGLGGGIKPKDLKRNTSNNEDLVSKLRQTEEEKVILQQRLEDIEVASEKREQEMVELKGEVGQMKALLQALLENRPSSS